MMMKMTMKITLDPCCLHSVQSMCSSAARPARQKERVQSTLWCVLELHLSSKLLLNPHLNMATNLSWKLKRFARYTPGVKDKTTIPWKVYESGEKKAPIVLTILDSGHLLVMQGQESLDTVHLVTSGGNIKVHKKSDNLLFRFNLKGESRMTRLQFEGKNKDDASKESANALKKVMEYLPVTSLEDAPQPPNQTHTQISTQVTQSGDDVGREMVQRLLPMKKLAQHFLGDINLTLPALYHHTHLPQGDLEPILRVFLLDPSFHAFVEKVEGALKTLMQE